MLLKDLSRLAPPFEQKVKETIQHARLLRSIEGIDPRELLQLATTFQQEALQLDKDLQARVSDVESLSRSARTDQMKGNLANIKAIRARLQKLLGELRDELNRLSKTASDKLNEPGRWGDAATVTGPLKEVMDLVAMVLDLISKYRQKSR